MGTPRLGAEVILSDPRYGIYHERMDRNSSLFALSLDGQTLFFLYKLADKEGLLVAYKRQQVQGVKAWVPKGIKVIPWETNDARAQWMNLATGLAYMAAFVAMAPAIGYGLAFASVGMFGDAAVALLPVGEKYAKQYAAEYLQNYFD